MTRKIWIMNHYSIGQLVSKGGRHYWFSKELKKRGYLPVVFGCNKKHNSVGGYFDFDGLWKEQLSEDRVPFVSIKSSSYKRNGLGRIKNMVMFAINMIRIAKDVENKYGKPDVIYASSVHPFTLFVGEYLAWCFKVKCIVEIRDLWPETFVALGLIKRESLFAKLLYAGEKWIYQHAGALIFTMEGGKDYIRDKGWDIEHSGKIDLSDVHYINNGIDLEQFNYNKEHYQIEDDDLNNPDIFKFVYTGSIRRANCVEKIIPVAEYFQHNGNNRIRFLIWGSGDCLPLIEKMINEKGLKNVVLKGSVEKKNIPFIVSSGDCNLFFLQEAPELYKYGVSTNKSFDYLAAGKPMLIFSHCGYSLVEKYQCGLHCHNNDTDSYINTIEEIFEISRDEYELMCANARRAAKEFDFSRLTDKLEAVLLS